MPHLLTTAMWDTLLQLVREHLALAEPIVFALGFGESIALLSLFVPSTILFIAIGGLHHAAGGSFVTVWLAGSAGAFLGDLLSYALGRVYKRDIGTIWPFRKRPGLMERSRLFAERHGGWGVIASKFLGPLRPFVPVMAGAFAMPVIAFVVASAVSCLMWAAVFLSPGYGLSYVLR